MGIENEPYNSHWCTRLTRFTLNKLLDFPIWPTGDHTFCRLTKTTERSIKLNLVDCLQLDETLQIVGIRIDSSVFQPPVCLRLHSYNTKLILPANDGLIQPNSWRQFRKQWGRTHCTFRKRSRHNKGMKFPLFVVYNALLVCFFSQNMHSAFR